MNPPAGVNPGKEYLELKDGGGNQEDAALRDQNCSLGQGTGAQLLLRHGQRIADRLWRSMDCSGDFSPAQSRRHQL